MYSTIYDDDVIKIEIKFEVLPEKFVKISDHWCLDTILQEKGNLRLYEKMGYVQTGKVEHINEKMDIVFYEKN